MKTPEEVQAIETAQRAVEVAVQRAIELLAAASLRNGLIMYEGEPVTSERIKKLINVSLMEQDCVAQHTIIAGGVQACDPHNEGSGPLKAGEPIVMDVFPRHMTTRYFADMSRTVLKGKARPQMKSLYETVRAAQAGVDRAEAILRTTRAVVEAQLRPGADASRAEAELAAAGTQLLASMEV